MKTIFGDITCSGEWLQVLPIARHMAYRNTESIPLPLGDYGPVTMGCVPHGQRLCLTVFVTLMLPQYLAHTPFSKC